MADVAGRWKGLTKLLGFLAILAMGILVARYSAVGDFLSREGIARAVSLLRDSTLAPLIFVPIYAGAVAVGIPGTLPTLAGGAVFGLWWGTVFNWTGAVVGANLAYLLARFLGRDGLTQLLGDRVRKGAALDRLDRAVRVHGFRGMLTLRLIPVIPFNALNFGGGLVGMGWASYALATGIGILPGTFVYTMFADALLEGSTRASRDAFIRMAVAGAALVVLSFLPLILRKLGIRVPALSTVRAPSKATGPETDRS
jgi:uncharacterized membrane protein YdjX (TVP38/TMEM64 family)